MSTYPLSRDYSASELHGYHTGTGTRDRTQDDRVKVCCVTSTPFPNKNLAYPLGLEPRLTVLETAMLPLHYGYMFGGPQENRTPTRGLQSHCATIITNSPYILKYTVKHPRPRIPSLLVRCSQTTLSQGGNVESLPQCVLECSVLLHHMTGLIPRPGVLQSALSPQSSCVLSARLRLFIVCLQVLVTWALLHLSNTEKEKPWSFQFQGLLSLLVTAIMRNHHLHKTLRLPEYYSRDQRRATRLYSPVASFWLSVNYSQKSFCFLGLLNQHCCCSSVNYTLLSDCCQPLNVFSVVFIPHTKKLRIWMRVTDLNCRCTWLMRPVW